MTVSATVARVAARLGEAGVASPRVDAELLVAHVLGVARGRLIVADPPDEHRTREIDALTARRAAREPLQHLLGTAVLGPVEVAVGPGVFVPRPETELLAGWGIEVARRAGPQPCVVDLCSGTGAVALALADEVPGARVVAVERSAEALRWLRRNVADAGAAVRVVAGDVTDVELLSELRGAVDVLLCNPPYVPDGTAVPPEVAEHDPAAAVFGGPDGLAVIRPVVALAAVLLRPGGALGVEHDDVHGRAVPDLLRADGRFSDVEDRLDLTGRPRYATARRRP